MGDFLFSVDVEDFPVISEGRETWAGGVPSLIARYLDLLKPRGQKATFFILGEVAERHPEMVKMLVEGGHEVGSHGYSHTPLDKLTPEAFRADVSKSQKVLREAGVQEIFGYRAPFLSLTKKTAWAYPILRDLGFTYSSSVLPRYNPLYSWPGFGKEPKLKEGVWEIPITPMGGLPLGIPVASGVYFRILPSWLTLFLLKKSLKEKTGVLSYFHPYDIDWQSKSRQCSWLTKNPIGNYLIFYNRHKLEKKLARAFASPVKVNRYIDYLHENFNVSLK